MRRNVFLVLVAGMFLALALQPRILAGSPRPPEPPPDPNTPWKPPPPVGVGGLARQITIILGPGGPGAAAAWMTDYQYQRKDRFRGSETLYLWVVSPFNTYWLWWYEYYPPGNLPQGHWVIWAWGPLRGGVMIIGPLSPEPNEPRGWHSERVWMMDATSGNWADVIARWNYEVPPDLTSTASHISLSQTQATPGQPVSISASVSPIPTGGSLSISVSQNAGQWTTVSSAPASTGSTTVSWTPPSPGTYQFKTTFSGHLDTGANKEYSQSESSPQTLAVQLIQTTLTLSLSPSSASIDVLTKATTPITISGTLTSVPPNPPPSGAFIILAISGPSGQITKTVVARPGGLFSESFTPSQSGVYTISASYQGDPTHQAAQVSQVTVTVTENPGTILALVGIVIVVGIAIVLVVVVYAMSRAKSRPPVSPLIRPGFRRI